MKKDARVDRVRPMFNLYLTSVMLIICIWQLVLNCQIFVFVMSRNDQYENWTTNIAVWTTNIGKWLLCEGLILVTERPIYAGWTTNIGK